MNLSTVSIILIFIVISLAYFFWQKQKKGSNVFWTAKTGTPILDLYSVDFTKLARDGKIDPVIGREEEVLRLAQVLSRRTKNNVLLVGASGVGKTAIVEGLAQRITQGSVPEVLQHKRVLSLQVASLLAGTKYRGEFEERAKKLVQEIFTAARQVILFIDEVHTVMQSRGTEGAVNFADILKPALSHGDLQLIGATTTNEYEQYIKPDESLERRFQVVEILEPSVDDTIKILQGVKDKYKSYHKVEFTDGAIVAAAQLAGKYIKGRHMPDKAIDVIDEAAAMVKVSHINQVVVGALHGAARDKNKSLAELWTKIQQIDKSILQTETAARAKLIAEREKYEQEVEGMGMTVVDVDDVKKIISEWSHVKF
ncbi:MAG: AAA family ATPase [Patescibacteria group bacterium]